MRKENMMMNRIRKSIMKTTLTLGLALAVCNAMDETNPEDTQAKTNRTTRNVWRDKDHIPFNEHFAGSS